MKVFECPECLERARVMADGWLYDDEHITARLACTNDHDITTMTEIECE